MVKQKITNSQQNNTITTGTNAGAGGGSTNFINLGGIKICWGITNAVAIAAGAVQDYVINFPLTFTTTPNVTVTGFGAVAWGDWMIPTANPVSTNTMTAKLHNMGTGTSSATYVSWIAIGV